MDIKKWFLKAFSTEPPPTPVIDMLSRKSSRIWGSDEEFDYEKAANILGQGIPQPSKLQTYSHYVKEYGNNIWVYAAVYLKAVSIASVPLRLYKKAGYKKGPEPYENKNNPLVKIFLRPNKYMSMFDLVEAVVAGLELTGNAYLEEVKDKNGDLEELYPLQPQKVKIVPDSKNLIKGYIYESARNVVAFNEDEITHIKYHNPESDFYGVSPMSSGEVSIIINNNAREWMRRFFKNSAVPGGALETEQILNESIVKRLKAQWKAAHKGIQRAHEVAILEGGLKWRNIEASAKDMDFATMRGMDRDEILTVFGVPAPMLGITGNINNSVMENVKKAFWENTLLPTMEKIEASINFNIVWPYDSTVYAAFDKDSIEALKGSQETRARIAAMLTDRGIMTPNEARRKFFNLPDKPWGDTWYMPLNLTPVDKAGTGLGVGNGEGGSGQVPGRPIGRPGVAQENLKNAVLKLTQIALQSIDKMDESVLHYYNDKVDVEEEGKTE